MRSLYWKVRMKLHRLRHGGHLKFEACCIAMVYELPHRLRKIALPKEES